jgi:PTH1 family peptidyl-tRNA hydrolase
VYLIVGLGNPGPNYEETRHNIGARVLEFWGRKLGVRWSGRLFQSRSGRARYEDQELLLICPETFMNRCGLAVKACVDYFKIDRHRILLVHDDLDLPLGRLKVVEDGGAGGHKGVLSVAEHLGNLTFSRIKVGIGRPRYGEAIEAYVLSRFYADEEGVVEEMTHLAAKGCELFVSRGVAFAMNQINSQDLSKKEVR